MAARRPGRYLAPIALLAAAAAIALVVKDHVHTHHPASTRTSNGVPLLQSTRQTPKVAHHRAARFYTVKSGDTLSQISERTHVPVAKIQRLNPGLNPNALQTGQRLRLRP